ncbi:MAG: hypothetical protein ABFD97_23520 [Syntrophobacter sp.]
MFHMERLEELFISLSKDSSLPPNSHGNTASEAENVSAAARHLVNIGYGWDLTIGELMANGEKFQFWNGVTLISTGYLSPRYCKLSKAVFREVSMGGTGQFSSTSSRSG